MIRSFGADKPRIHSTAFIHPSSELIGRIEVKENASIWPMVVLRGDIERITIGAQANVQDATVMHTSKGLPVVLETGVTIGHGAIVHGAKIGAYSLIGMGAILLDGCEIGAECLIGAGAVVPEHVKIPAQSLVLGIPGKVVRTLRPEELEMLHQRAKDYVHYAQEHRIGSHPIN